MASRILEIHQSSTEDQSLAAYKAESEDGIYWYYCIAQDDIYLLARDIASPIELTTQLNNDSPSDVDRYDAETDEFKVKRDGVDIPAVLEYFNENVDVEFECWKNDGGEGLSEAAESENGVFYVLAYKLWHNINYYYQYLDSYDDSVSTFEAVCTQFMEEVPEIEAFDADNWISENG